MVATKFIALRSIYHIILSITLLVAGIESATAVLLPEEKAEVNYHYYDGGGVEVDGPTLIVRKNFKDKISVAAGYHADVISSASIDVVTQASPYSEERQAVNLESQYLHQDTLFHGGMAYSDESDYQATTAFFGLSQTFFSGMSTFDMTYTRGWDSVERSDTDFSKDLDRHKFTLGLNQTLSPKWVATFLYEGVAESGYLSNPYRGALVRNAPVPERHPEARTSQSFNYGNLYYLGQNMALKGGLRFYTDTWGISATTLFGGFVHQTPSPWRYEIRYEYYTQSEADFYFDNADRLYNFISRDKELSRFDSHQLGGDVSYRLGYTNKLFDNMEIGISLDWFRFSYDNFSDRRQFVADDPDKSLDQYTFTASVWQLYFSGWY